MATPRLLSLSRTLLTKPTFLRSFSTATATPTRSSLTSGIRPLSSAIFLPKPTTAFPLPSLTVRSFATRQQINDNSGNRPPKETILLDGCDFEHWLVVTDPPPPEWTRDDIIDSYVKTLAGVLGSEEEARMKIYSVSTKHYFAFGALVSEEISYKLKELPNIRWVLPDSYLDVRNKDYGGEPFINGQAVPYDPKYHEEWVRNNTKALDRNRRSDRPRNADRSRNFERRNRTAGPPSGFQNNPSPPANAGRPGGNMGGMPNQPGGYPQNMPPNNAGFAQNMPPNNAGYAQNMPPNNAGYAQNNQGFAPNMAPNNPNNMSGPPSYGGQGNPGYSNNTSPNYQGGGRPPYQNPQMGNQQYAPQNPQMGNQQYAPQSNMGGQPGGGYQGQDVPGRDVPQY